MNALDCAEAYGLLYKRICNPNSACPDIEIGQVFTLMVDIAVEHSNFDWMNWTVAQKWVYWYVLLAEKSGQQASQSWLEIEWSDKNVHYDSSYFDKAGKRKSQKAMNKEWSEYEAEKKKKSKEMNLAINKLIKSKHLVKKDGYLKLVTK